MKYTKNQQVRVLYMGRWRIGKIINPLPIQPLGKQMYRVEVLVPNFETEIVKVEEENIKAIS